MKGTEEGGHARDQHLGDPCVRSAVFSEARHAVGGRLELSPTDESCDGARGPGAAGGAPEQLMMTASCGVSVSWRTRRL